MELYIAFGFLLGIRSNNMSKIAISGAATGTATFTIESPATSTNRTITLPDATGTLALTGTGLTGTTDSGTPFETSLGTDAGAVNTGVNNTFIGFEAGNDNTTGTNNTAVGFRALDANTTGIFNTAVGATALGATTTGTRNTAIGESALALNTTGQYNTAIGRAALETNSTASNNTAVGFEALNANTTGANNVAVGFQALDANTTGAQNVAIGVNALGANTTGALNSAFGDGALCSNTTANANNAFGNVALGKNTTGTGNQAMGREAMEFNTTGSCNIGIGQEVLRFNTTGSNNVAVGTRALHSITCGCNNIGIGATAGVTGLSPAGIVNITTECNRIVFGNDLHTCAQIKIAWTATSDCRDKMCFAPIPVGLDFVRALKPTEYQFKAGSRNSEHTDGKRRYGFLAQDVLPLEGDNPVIISADDPDKLQYTEAHLIPVLVKAIQELTARVEQLENA
jgi:trimeric autotransporter adhesin